MLDNMLIHTPCCPFICSAAHLYAPPLICTLRCLFIISYALLLICMLCRSFICSLLLLHSFLHPTIALSSCVSSLIHAPCSSLTFVFSVHVHMPCGHMHLWALHPHLGPSVGMKELLCPFATSQCMQMNSHGWSVHAGVHVMGLGRGG